MKLEEGMFIRHSGLDGEYPIIQKITKLESPGRCGAEYKVFTDKCEDWFIDSDYIEINKSKYSFNIIDLIELGDIIIVDEFPIGNEKCYDLLLKVDPFNMYKLQVYDVKIKFVITKEQFESIGYRIKE